MKKEIWRDIKNYEKLYQISNHGRVKSLKRKVRSNVQFKRLRTVRERILKHSISGNGYYHVVLCKQRRNRTKTIARLVAQTFIKNPLNLPEVNHKDGNKINNYIKNLEWISRSENCLHAYKIGLSKPPMPMLGKFGKEHHGSKAVLQFSLIGNLIFKYGSILEAERKIGISDTGIYNVCRGKQKTAGNYIWRYV